MVENQLLTGELGQEDMQQVLRRAQELEMRQTAPASAKTPGGIAAFVQAAEEAGISRESTMQALREQFGHPEDGVSVGQRVYAKSADGYYYVARVVKINGERIDVRYDIGGENSVPVTDVRGFSILPGQKLQANWPGWGWYSVKVVAYDDTTNMVRLTDNMTTETLPITEVRLKSQATPKQEKMSSIVTRTALISGGIGAAIGAIIMRLLMH